MTEAERIVNSIQHFFIDVFEGQKDIDLKVYAESSPKYLFKKKDYKGNIDEYKRLKNIALDIDTGSFAPDESDDDLIELVCLYEEVLAIYNMYVDRCISVQEYLRRKASDEKYKASEYTAAVTRQKNASAAFSRSYNELNAAYANYMERMVKGE